MIAADLAQDTLGILLFLLWLAIPPAYTVILGRRYVARCRDELTHTRDYLEQLRDDVETAVDDSTLELPQQTGRHHLRR